MRKGTIIFVFLLLGVLLFIYTLKKVGFEAVKEAVFMFSYSQLFLLLLLLAAGMVGMGTLRWRLIMKTLDVPVPKYSKLALIKLVGYSLSYLTPAALFGGEPARFYILRTEDEKENSRLAASIIVDKMMQTFSSAFFFFSGLVLFLIYLDLSRMIEILLLVILVIVILLIFFLIKRVQKVSQEKGFFISALEFLYLNKIKKIKDMHKTFRQIEEEIRKFFHNSKKILLKTILLTFAEVIFVLIVFWLIIFFMGHVLTIPRVLVIRSMTDLSMIIPFPASLGTLEVAQAFAFENFSLGAATGVGLSLIFRGISLALSFLGLIVFVFFHIKGAIDRFSRKILKLIPNNEEKNSA